MTWPSDPLFGATNYSVGPISGGVAPNVIAPNAGAELMFRTVGDYLDVRAMLAAAAGPMASVEDVLVVPPVRLHTRRRVSTPPCLHLRRTCRFSTLGHADVAGPGIHYRGPHG